ncbi:hypothetical protein TSUD_365970 [Trifolium subterraneum]|uniref:Right handed beta helix domain-containing protein n=1 Tax=Trifolium subterraneum TaxID=3900 RepID=A0A2Z6NY71_TRISU|nr:hypothetical protein TSUD_365970 [Trifolium subterraneum]
MFALLHQPCFFLLHKSSTLSASLLRLLLCFRPCLHLWFQQSVSHWPWLVSSSFPLQHQQNQRADNQEAEAVPQPEADMANQETEQQGRSGSGAIQVFGNSNNLNISKRMDVTIHQRQNQGVTIHRQNQGAIQVVGNSSNHNFGEGAIQVIGNSNNISFGERIGAVEVFGNSNNLNFGEGRGAVEVFGNSNNLNFGKGRRGAVEFVKLISVSDLSPGCHSWLWL